MTNSGRVLVTGASGFVGSAVAKLLAEQGFRVRALVRAASPRAHLNGVEIEYVTGDLRDPASLAPAMSGIQYLFHVAADYRLWARDPREIIENNVAGTRAIMDAALGAGVERVIYTSSVATLALKPDGQPVDESMPLAEVGAIGAYKKSKVAAERLVERMIAERKLPAVIVNPSTPVGPRDVRPTPTGRIILEAARGRVPGYIETGLNFVHVDDVAAGHLAALEKGRIGERYILGGENVPLSKMLTEVTQIAGRKPPRWKFSRQMIMPVAYFAETAAKFTGREPFITMDGLRLAKYHMFFQSGKAERELGYRARPYREGIADAIEWFGKAGYLK